VVLWGVLLPCVAAGGALAAVASSRNIGQLSTTPTSCAGAGPQDWIQISNHSDVTYAAPSGSWLIDSWSAYSNLSGPAGSGSLLVVRPVGGGYKVVDESATESIPGTGESTFSSSLHAEGGDLIGFWVKVDFDCIAETPNLDDVIGFGSVGSGKPPVGTVIPSGSLSSFAGLRLNVRAHLSTPEGKAAKREAYCMPAPVLRADGTTGTFVDLEAGQPASDARYAGAVPAGFGQGYGLTCDNLAARGYTDAGHTVDGTGSVNPAAALNVYEYFTK
jgi:hypothetical protein